MDAYASPGADRPPATPQGELDVGVTVSEAVGALLSNLVPLVGGVIALIALYALSCLTIIGWIAIWPVLAWGFYAFVLEAVDGRARIGTLVSGFERFGRAFGQIVVYILMMFVLAIPLGILSAVASLPELLSGAEPDTITTTLRTLVPSLIWSLLVVRFMLVPFLMVDRDIGPLDAFGDAWSLTSGQWGRLMLVQLLVFVISAPSQALQVGATVSFEQAGAAPDPADLLPAFGALFAAMGTGLFAYTLGMLLFASAYRQLAGRPDTPEGGAA